MMTKTYTSNDAIKIGKEPFGQEKYKLSYRLPSGKQYSILGSFPEALAESANRMIQANKNMEAAKVPYMEAVKHLVEVALTQDGSGAKAAAQVILSAYNGRRYQLDITDLCSLDAENFKHAKNLISGRVHTYTEPHDMIENGNQVFDQLEEQYDWLEVRNRYIDFY